MPDFVIDWDPAIHTVVEQFVAWGLAIKSLREPLKRSIQKVVAPAIQQNFDEGGRPSWTPLADMTERIKAAKGYDSGRPLIASGTLKQAAGQLNIWTIDGPVGTATLDNLPDRAWYGVVHNEGGGWNNIPQREWSSIPENDTAKLDDIFLDWIMECAVVSGAAGGI